MRWVIPDNYCDEISDNQTVKATGNGWAVLGLLTLILALMEEHQESTNPPLLIASVGDMCPSHKPNLKDSYVQWHDWAESQVEKGIKQTQCEKCKRWFFPSEL